MAKKTKRQRIDEYKKRMQELIGNGDCEIAHAEGDDLLCKLLDELGYGEVVEIYDKICKWYA